MPFRTYFMLHLNHLNCPSLPNTSAKAHSAQWSFPLTLCEQTMSTALARAAGASPSQLLHHVMGLGCFFWQLHKSMAQGEREKRSVTELWMNRDSPLTFPLDIWSRPSLWEWDSSRASKLNRSLTSQHKPCECNNEHCVRWRTRGCRGAGAGLCLRRNLTPLGVSGPEQQTSYIKMC